MTVANNYSPTRQIGNGVTTAFSFNFKVVNENQVVVYERDANDEQTIVDPSAYSVSLTNSGGMVTFNTAPADGVIIAITRDTPQTQETPYKTSQGFPAAVVEGDFDKLTMMVQELQQDSDRSVKVDVTSSTTPEVLINEVERVYSSIDNIDTVADDITNVNTVAGVASNVTTVAGISSDVTAVAGNATNITTVAGNTSNINAVSVDLTNVDTVATNISDVNAVGQSIANVNSVAGDLTNIDDLVDDLANVDAVAGDLTNIDAVAGNLTNINAVNSNKTNIDTVASDINRVGLVADDIASVHTVAVDISNVIDVASISSDVSAVASNATNINAVAGNETNINTVASNATNINTVASNASNINAVAGDLTNIDAVASDLTNIDNASSYAAEAEDWATKMDGMVGGEDYSAKYYAAQAKMGRNIGEIVQSTIPLTDAGLHLLDGSLISGSGSYADFVTYIAGLVSTYPDLFETEANWQSSVSTYGVCGKFVYDNVNNTVRLPKITGFTEGTINPTTLGDLTEAGLPNIEGEYTSGSWINVDSKTGAFANITTRNNETGASSGSDTNFKRAYIKFDASLSSSTYGNSSTVQPQSIKVLYYIVIATSVKTSIEVDIDEIATDLAGKVDLDYTNADYIPAKADLSNVSVDVAAMGEPDYSRATTLAINTESPFDAWWWGDVNHYQNWAITLPDGTTTKMTGVSAGGLNSTCFQFFPKGTKYTSAYNNYVPKLLPLKGQ